MTFSLVTAVTLLMIGQAPDAQPAPAAAKGASTSIPDDNRSALSKMLARTGTRLTERQTELAYVRGAKGSVRVFVLRVDDHTRRVQAEGIRLRISRQGCNREVFIDAQDLDRVLEGLKWIKVLPRLGTFQSGEKSVTYRDDLRLRTDHYSTPSAPIHIGASTCEARFSLRQASGLRRALRQGQDFLASTK